MCRSVLRATTAFILVLAASHAVAAAEGAVEVRHWSHVILHVEDIEASLAFFNDTATTEIYTDEEVAGADFEKMVGVEGATARIINLVLGGQKVELIGLNGVPAGAPAKRVGRGLAGFAVRVDDIDAAHRLAQEHAVCIESKGTESEGVRQFVVVDPDGVHVEISQPPAHLERFGPYSGR
jgi:catechol 2,3-dioxygenase-like lactoylglutathione lyase family enzyme